MAYAYDQKSPGAILGDPNAPPPVMAPPTAPPAPPSLYESMKKRMDAVQSGQPDTGNADLYGYNQTVPGASVANPTGYGTPAPAAAAAPTGPTATSVGEQAKNASTYSATPGAAPTANTANQGAQDVYRNSLLERATQGTDVDTNDPTFRKVADTYAASQERTRRNATDMGAESMAAQGMGSSGALDNERRLQTEKAAQASSGFESQLALSELQNKRSEIQSALSELGSTISGDQARALTDKLAMLDATIKRESLSQTGSLGQADISLRDRLGTQGNNLSALELLLRNKQNNDRLGFDIGNANAGHNNDALRMLMGS